MKNMRKYLLIGMIITLLPTLTGCGINNSDTSQDSDGKITETEAKEIALEQVPGATFEDIKKWGMDNHLGNLQYEGEIYYQNQEYDFEIDATDGRILGWSVETPFD